MSDGTANSNTVEAWIAVGGYLGPRTNQDGSPQDLSLLHGSLERVEQLTLGVTLTYQSESQASAIVVVETSLLGSSVPSAISAQLTFNGMAGTKYGYNTYGLWPGRSLRFALQADTSALSTGRYSWQMDVTTTIYCRSHADSRGSDFADSRCNHRRRWSRSWWGNCHWQASISGSPVTDWLFRRSCCDGGNTTVAVSGS